MRMTILIPKILQCVTFLTAKKFEQLNFANNKVVLQPYLHTGHLFPLLPLTFFCHWKISDAGSESTLTKLKRNDARAPPSAVARALLQLNDGGSNMRRRRRLRRNHPQTQTVSQKKVLGLVDTSDAEVPLVLIILGKEE